MSSSKKISAITSESLENSQEYFKNSWEYYKLKLFLHTAELSTALVKYAILGIFAFIAVVLLSVSLAIFLGQLLSSSSLGFLLTASLFVLLILVVFSIRKKLERYIVKKLAKSILHDD
ncbi:hypothetical protein GTQ34_07465 [Muricauda sp. JGD-17]|uniref:Phage holin family protein n=1 Tax=Flagellimonas ochracea TaxID=2696472 RepID=A0A964WX70_9FLAO|nr:hypothetical protein [Allomuricauda ochracea]NAY91750.1 hypothetical protein [Allomuricauda ochracea]